MALGVKYNLPIHHADIPQAFIQSTLDRDIYITMPPGVSVKHDVLNKMQRDNPNSKILSTYSALGRLDGEVSMLYRFLRPLPKRHEWRGHVAAQRQSEGMLQAT